MAEAYNILWILIFALITVFGAGIMWLLIEKFFRGG